MTLMRPAREPRDCSFRWFRPSADRTASSAPMSAGRTRTTAQMRKQQRVGPAAKLKLPSVRPLCSGEQPARRGSTDIDSSHNEASPNDFFVRVAGLSRLASDSLRGNRPQRFNSRPPGRLSSTSEQAKALRRWRQLTRVDRRRADWNWDLLVRSGRLALGIPPVVGAARMPGVQVLPVRTASGGPINRAARELSAFVNTQLGGPGPVRHVPG